MLTAIVDQSARNGCNNASFVAVWGGAVDSALDLPDDMAEEVETVRAPGETRVDVEVEAALCRRQIAAATVPLFFVVVLAPVFQSRDLILVRWHVGECVHKPRHLHLW